SKLRATTTPTTRAGKAIGGRWRSSSDDRDRHDAVPFCVEPPLRVVERALHGLLLRIGELAARRHPAGQLPHRDERAGHFAPADVGIGVARDEQLLEEGQAALL